MGKYNYTRLSRVIAPSQLPVSLDTAKSHLRVDHSDDDTYITSLIWSASRTIEDYTKKSLSDQTFAQYHSEWPEKYVELLIGHDTTLPAIGSVKYYDVDGVQQTIHPSNYFDDSSYNPMRLYWASTFSKPNISKDKPQVEIIFRCGNTISSNPLPYSVQQALLLLVGHYYENRMAVINTLNRELPMGVDYLLDGFKIYSA